MAWPAAGAEAPAAAPAPASEEGERRHATVAFSDLSGYTALNERLDPEEVEAIMARIKREAVAIVERHGGTIELETEQGRGTTFRIRLPRRQEAALPRRIPAAEAT